MRMLYSRMALKRGALALLLLLLAADAHAAGEGGESMRHASRGVPEHPSTLPFIPHKRL